MKIQMGGDSHCDKSYWNRLLHEAQYNRANCAWIVGDVCIFTEGYAQLSKAATAYNKDVFINDGNHDDHDFLQSLPTRKYNFPWGSIECAQIAPFLWYVPRGTAFEWDGKKFLVVGGAFSIDKESRLERMSMGGRKEWWEQETITQQDADKAREAGKVDIMITHDAPHFVDLSKPMDGYGTFHMTEVNRNFLDDICLSARPKLLVHGHYHYYADREFHYAPVLADDGEGIEWTVTRTVSLGCNFDEDRKSMWVLNTEAV